AEPTSRGGARRGGPPPVQACLGQLQRLKTAAPVELGIRHFRRTLVGSCSARGPHLAVSIVGCCHPPGLLSRLLSPRALLSDFLIAAPADSNSQRWWAAVDSNHLPPRYQHGALPVELAAHRTGRGGRIRTLGPRFWRPML